MQEIIEQWKPVAGYEGLYEVSNMGRVRSLDIPKNGKGTKHHFGVLKKTYIGKTGYRYCMLHKKGQPRKLCTLHRLMALVFIPNPKNLPFINHIDHDRTNNDLSNLEWVDARINTWHAVIHNRCNKIGIKKIDDATRELLRQEHANGLSFVKLAKKYNISSRQAWVLCSTNKRSTNLKTTTWELSQNLPSDIVEKIKAERASGTYYLEIAKKYKVTYGFVKRAVSGVLDAR